MSDNPAEMPAQVGGFEVANRGPADDGPLSVIGEALKAFAQGEILVVVDDEDRENEGDLIMAAEHVTPEKIAFFLHHTSGFICAPITSERAAELDLRPMVEHNTESMRTAFLVSIDYRHGTSTGISSFDRATTVQALVDPDTRPGDFAREVKPDDKHAHVPNGRIGARGIGGYERTPKDETERAVDRSEEPEDGADVPA